MSVGSDRYRSRFWNESLTSRCFRRANLLCCLCFVLVTFASISNAQTRKRIPAKSPTAWSLAMMTIQTEPHAIIWLDEVRRGVTDDSGRLYLMKISPGSHVMRVRAKGFRETVVTAFPDKRGILRLVRTSDEAELTFQRAEEAREQATDDESRQQAVELYRRALKLRPAFPAARVGLARSLMERNQYQEALTEIEAARRTRPIYAEASAVEGRIYREMAFADDAIKSFQRAIREARSLQPEAHVGLARVYEDRGQYEEAAGEYQTAIKQLADTEPVIYQLLGATFEKIQKYKEAVAAYEKYLQLAPKGNLAPAVRSILEQVRREAAGQELKPE